LARVACSKYRFRASRAVRDRHYDDAAHGGIGRVRQGMSPAHARGSLGSETGRCGRPKGRLAAARGTVGNTVGREKGGEREEEEEEGDERHV